MSTVGYGLYIFDIFLLVKLDDGKDVTVAKMV